VSRRFFRAAKLRKAGELLRIIFRYILNNIRERKLRTAVMLLSIVLSAVLLFVSLCIGDSYEAAQRKMAKGMAGNRFLPYLYLAATLTCPGCYSHSRAPGHPL
ncbi:hypothetical protein, partial [Eubacterium callanderi]|uniref:hypothetical protein n=1 Tax=Eubacterium callanderi TaxID=53442 RepID=UPI00210A23DB